MGKRIRSIYRALSGLAPHGSKAFFQRVFWVYVTNYFAVRTLTDFHTVEPKVPCRFVPITTENYARVTDFREDARERQYRDKLARHELGFFAEHDGCMAGSIWATINRSDRPGFYRNHVRLQPNEALLHDVVTSDRLRGQQIGPYMVGRLFETLILDHRVDRILWDVHFANEASMRMFEKLGLMSERRVVSLCILGQLIHQWSTPAAAPRPRGARR